MTGADAVDVSSLFYEAGDGLRLHLRTYRPRRDEGRTPVVCLPGLTRGAADFAPLALALAGAGARRVMAFDCRGRGLSAHDPDWRHYSLDVERDDVLTGLAIEGVAAAHFVGTSRGGLHIMALAETHRTMIRAAVLNDIGPVLEPDGLARIKGYVGRDAEPPRSLAEAIERLKRGPALTFTGLSDAEWHLLATTTYGDDPNDLRLRSDPMIARSLDELDLSKPLPNLWAQYDALRGAPLLTVRGDNSDLLSVETLAAMGARWPGCETHIVPGQGHAPLLADAPTIARIAAFLAAADTRGE